MEETLLREQLDETKFRLKLKLNQKKSRIEEALSLAKGKLLQPLLSNVMIQNLYSGPHSIIINWACIKAILWSRP